MATNTMPSDNSDARDGSTDTDEQNDSEIEIDGAGVTTKSIDRGGRVDVASHGDGVFVNIQTDYISSRLFLSPEQAAAIAEKLEDASE